MKRFSKQFDPFINAMRSTNEQSMSEDAKRRVRVALFAEAERVAQGESRRYEGRKPLLYSYQHTFMVAGIIAAIVFLIGGGTVAAADGAKPGDALFGIDRAAERVHLVLTVQEEARVRLKTDIAEERERERLALAEENKTQLSLQAEGYANDALIDAIETLSQVRTKLQSNENPGDAAGTLNAVELRLRTILALRRQAEEREQSQEREREQEGTDGSTINVNVNEDVNSAIIDDSSSAGQPTDNTGDNSSDNDNGTEQSGQNDTMEQSGDTATGNDDQVSQNNDDNSTTNDAGNDTPGDTGNGSDDQGNSGDDNGTNSNANVDTNTNVNAPTNTNQDSGNGNEGSEETDVQEIRVNVDNGQAAIRVHIGNSEQEWELATTDQSTILLSISARTGLTASQIEAVWEYRQHGDN